MSLGWPYTLTDPVQAVHLALDPHCPYQRPAVCPQIAGIERTIAAYDKWRIENEERLKREQHARDKAERKRVRS